MSNHAQRRPCGPAWRRPVKPAVRKRRLRAIRAALREKGKT